jgi:hypothetical protein
MIDYQIKGHVVRFADSQYAFLMRLSIWAIHLLIFTAWHRKNC